MPQRVQAHEPGVIAEIHAAFVADDNEFLARDPRRERGIQPGREISRDHTQCDPFRLQPKPLADPCTEPAIRIVDNGEISHGNQLPCRCSDGVNKASGGNGGG